MLNKSRLKNLRLKSLFTRIKKEQFSSKKTLRRILLLALLSLVFYLFFAGDYGFLRLLSLKKQKENIILETKKLQAQNMDFTIEKERLKNDLFHIEKVARERYGMAKKNEVIYKFIQPQDSSSTLLPKENR